MGGEFVTKRPHKKSRGGCQTCKTKKVKCDETQPKCGFCEKRDFKCVYINKPSNPPTPASSSRSSSIIDFSTPPESQDTETFDELMAPGTMILAPEPAISTSVGSLSRTDLRLMHHWLTSTWNTVAVGDDQNCILLLSVPQLAFQNEYLLNCILGIASLHQEVLNPASEEYPKTTVGYRVRALNGFREALSGSDGQSLDWEAACMTALLLLILCSKDRSKCGEQLTCIDWLVLYRGIGAVITLRTWDELVNTAISPIFKRSLTTLHIPPSIPKTLMHLLSTIPPTSPDYPLLRPYCFAVECLGALYASLQQSGLTDDLFIRTLTWPSYLPQELVDCAIQKRPIALVILAYYLIFIKLIRGIWWVDNVADVEIGIIESLVGEGYAGFMTVPMEATKTGDREEIVRILLR
ncbi:hypothetical protein HYALB_00005853 [Hymenoscyphus albidus]|uniref:Zn(2)-C6 fungal-type domain-containing protein n=1 Tax=Hymenoscyphus albidus TaxID=595503 RepID=A0A9N9LWH1_9HELO|nr:hypothetical protein HYALB_00005853 [Hymenoscyphus albidus]